MHFPGELSKRPDVPSLSVHIVQQFSLPIITIRFWHGLPFASAMLVPKTTVYEDNGLVARYDYIRLPGQMPIVEPISITHFG